MISALASLGKMLVVDLATTGARALVRVVRKKVDEPEPEEEAEPSAPWTYQDVKRANDASHVPERFKVRKEKS